MIQRIHDRYILKQFLRVLFFSLLFFTVIYVTVDIFEELDNFIDHKARLTDVFFYYFYSIPYILSYIMPLSLLLATIFSLGVLGRRNEITALISSGVSLVRIAMPIIMLSTIISFVSIGMDDTIVNMANRKRLDIKHYEIEGRKRQDPLSKKNFHYLGDGGIIYLARHYDHKASALYDVVLQKFENNTLVRRIDAKKATWDGNKWVFSSGFDRTFSTDSEKVRPFKQLSFEGLQERPADFIKEEIDEENMNAGELREYINRIRKSGGTIEKYLVDLYFKFSYPLAGAIFVLIGISFTSGKRRQSIATGFGTALIISFLYYGILRTGRTLGQNGIIPPLLAAQMGNIIFLIVGLSLLRRANR